MTVHRCEDCDRDDFKTARGLESHRRMKHPPQLEGNVHEATVIAVAAAKKSGQLTDVDAGAVAVILDLAKTIDGMATIDYSAEDPPPLDNVTIPTYLKYAAELGLTPLSRTKLEKKEKSGGSKLGKLRSIEGGRAS